MNNRYVIGIDIGTSGCKTILVDELGNAAYTKTVEYPLYTPRQGWTEQVPEDWWIAAVEGIQEVLSKSGIDPLAIKGVGLSGQMHGMVAIDRKGKVIRNAILWNDQRTAKQCDEITDTAGGPAQLLKMTNNLMLPGYTGGKILWMRENEPENYEKTVMILNPKDYLRYRLTGEFATEVSDASGTGLFDVKNRCWCTELLDMLHIPLSLLPICVESTDKTGVIRSDVSELTGLPDGIPVVGGGGDSVIQTTGMGLIREGILGLTIGTAGITAMGLGSFRENQSGRLQVFCNNAPDLWHVMGVAMTAGGAYQWYKNKLCEAEITKSKNNQADVYSILDAQAKESPHGSNNLLFLPYLNGERCPYSDPHAKAAFIGLTLQHNKNDMTRSLLEGVMFSQRQIYNLIVSLDKNIEVSEIILSGGGSKSPLWRQICADVFQSPVKTVSCSAEGGAYGAALVAGIGCDIWSSLDEAVRILRIESITEPDTNSKNIYDHLFSIYDPLYNQLKDTFSKLSIS